MNATLAVQDNHCPKCPVCYWPVWEYGDPDKLCVSCGFFCHDECVVQMWPEYSDTWCCIECSETDLQE